MKIAPGPLPFNPALSVSQHFQVLLLFKQKLETDC